MQQIRTWNEGNCFNSCATCEQGQTWNEIGKDTLIIVQYGGVNLSYQSSKISRIMLKNNRIYWSLKFQSNGLSFLPTENKTCSIKFLLVDKRKTDARIAHEFFVTSSWNFRVFAKRKKKSSGRQIDDHNVFLTLFGVLRWFCIIVNGRTDGHTHGQTLL